METQKRRVQPESSLEKILLISWVTELRQDPRDVDQKKRQGG